MFQNKSIPDFKTSDIRPTDSSSGLYFHSEVTMEEHSTCKYAIYALHKKLKRCRAKIPSPGEIELSFITFI
jgi:hypothetical protein